MEYILQRQTILPTTRERAWRFFSDPRNLTYITPPELNFRVQSDSLPQSINEGLLVKYTVSPIAGIPLKWVSKITDVQVERCFVDEQIRGPYAFWKHEHRFDSHPAGVLMEDIVRYRLPLGFLGRICHALFVKKQLRQIFDYREHKIQFLFQ